MIPWYGEVPKYTSIQKIEVSEILYVFKGSLLCSPNLYLLNQKYSQLFFLNIFLNGKAASFDPFEVVR